MTSTNLSCNYSLFSFHELEDDIPGQAVAELLGHLALQNTLFTHFRRRQERKGECCHRLDIKKLKPKWECSEQQQTC